MKVGTLIGLQGGLVTITELMRVGTSNILGIGQIAEFVGGTYHVTFVAAGYVTQTQIITIKLGDKMEITVEMVEV